MASVRRSLVLSFAERYSAFAVTLIATFILARLLTPREIGIYSIAAVVVSLAHTLRDFGLGEYLIQERDLTVARLRTAFGIGILISWSIAALLVATALPVAEFYEEPGVGHVMRVVALSFVLLPFTTIPLSLWRRELRFGPPYIIKTLGAIAYSTTSVSLALTGFGYISLAWAPVVGTATSVLLGNVLFRHNAMPWLPGLSEVRHVFGFTAFASSGALLREAVSSAPDLIIGKALGMTDVGLFGRATSVIRLFQNNVGFAVRGISIPMFAQAARRGDDVGTVYIKAFEIFSGVAWPFFAVLTILAYPAIRILYGPQWDAAVPILQVLCLYGGLRAPFQLSGQALMATGGVKGSTLLIAVLLTLTLLFTMVAAPHGLAWVALGLCLAGAVSTALSLYVVQRHLGIRIRDLAGAIRRSIMLAACAAICPLGLVAISPTGPTNYWVPGVVGGSTAALGWIAGIFLLNHALKAEALLAWGYFTKRSAKSTR